MQFKAFFNKYKKIVFGDSSVYDLQKRIFLLITHITLIIGFSGIIIDIVLGLDYFLIFITVFLFLIVLFLHIRVKNTRPDLKYTAGIFIVSVVGLSCLWLLNGGYNGNNSVLIFVYFLVMITILPNKWRLGAFFVYSIMIVGLITLQYFFPQFIVPYESPHQQYIDLSIGYVLYFILGYNIQKTILSSYEYEHEAAKLKNDQLYDLNQKLSRINNELENSVQKVQELNFSKDRFITVLSHDLRSPFQGLLGITKILESEYDTISDNERKKLIIRTNDTLQRLYSFLQGLLLWGKIQKNTIKLTLEKINVKEILQESIAFFFESTQQKKISIMVNCDENIYVTIDKEMISVVFRNVISNAVKFSPAGSRVTINAVKETNSVVISITDEGIGIAEDYLAKLFHVEEHFSTVGTSGEEGSGIGLILCKDILKKHRGKISVVSKEGKGSTFTLELPDNLS